MNAVPERYSRQIPVVGLKGQEKIMKSVVLVAGLGGLGSIVSMYLAAAGVGTLLIFDHDLIEESNLNRQILYDEASIGLPKAPLAARRLRLLNSSTKVVFFQEQINRNTLNSLEIKPDIIIDALDNWSARLELDAYACRNHIPIVHAAIDGLHGQLLVTQPYKGICLKCIAPRQNQTRKTPIPSIGAAVGVLGSLEALAAISAITGKDWIRRGTLYVIDLSKDTTIEQVPLAGCT